MLKEMRDNFERSQEFLDLEKSDIDPLEKSKKEVHATLSQLLENANTTEELAKVQMLISQLVSCKAKASPVSA
jgi:hypothetical protein